MRKRGGVLEAPSSVLVQLNARDRLGRGDEVRAEATKHDGSHHLGTAKALAAVESAELKQGTRARTAVRGVRARAMRGKGTCSGTQLSMQAFKLSSIGDTAACRCTNCRVTCQKPALEPKRLQSRLRAALPQRTSATHSRISLCCVSNLRGLVGSRCLGALCLRGTHLQELRHREMLRKLLGARGFLGLRLRRSLQGSPGRPRQLSVLPPLPSVDSATYAGPRGRVMSRHILTKATKSTTVT